jgi:cation diffusion facilitator family transporter
VKRSHRARSPSSAIAIWAALAANVGVALAKLAAAIVSGSPSLAAETLHSFADCGNEVLLLWGRRRSERPPDAHHPYGHGKELYFFALMVGVLFFAIGGCLSIVEGVYRVVHPEPLRHPAWGVGVILASLVFEGTSLAIGLRQLRRHGKRQSILKTMKRSKDPGIFMVVAEDLAAMAGLAIALIGTSAAIALDAPICDAIGSILVGLLLAGVALFMIKETMGLLVGEASDGELIRDVERRALAEHTVAKVGRPLTMHLGPDEVLLNLELAFRDGLDIGEVRAALARLEHDIVSAHPEVTRFFVGSLDPHGEPGSGPA